MAYSHKELDRKWQERWANAACFTAKMDPSKPKYYCLDMFPYPSGSGLHVGHLASYTPPDVVSRYKRTQGFQVLHPMGYDAFGLPAEQYAIQTGIHPAETTRKSIDNFRHELKSLGVSFDWSREISTCEPNYYKWTQYIFIKLFERGLAYQKEVPVNWCPALKTVLANEEVVDGKSERGGHPVIRMPMKQWMLKITEYAERLLNDLDKLDWPERTKEGQRNWIGKSEGAKVFFKLESTSDKLEIFTTRPDTIFGATFMVLAPEHPLVEKLTSPTQRAQVSAYLKTASSKSEVDRKVAQDKTGVFSGGYALHPFDAKIRIPIWIADYVLMDYGTGAIMAVPGHDQRDFEFASKYDLPIVRVLESSDALPFEGDGKLINSSFLDGLDKSAAITQMLNALEAENIGKRQVHYKLRDWLFSRQRYWGEPFPIVHFEGQGPQAVPINELPVLLPPVADYEPSDRGDSPLAKVKDFVEYVSQAGVKGRRETDTMPGSAGSSWYFLRYTDPHNDQEPFSFEAQKYWMPVDLYVGGPEHTVGHLLYARFWQKVLFDVGLATHDEPFKKLAHQGVVMGPDGQRMSKSRGNVVNIHEVRDEFGADAARLYICFLGPFEKDKPWATKGIEGVRRFLERLYRLVVGEDGQVLDLDDSSPEELTKLTHKTIRKIGDDIEAMSFNTAVSTMMILVNEMYRLNAKPRSTVKPLIQLLAPFAPHIAEELWEKIGEKDFVSLAPWPKYDSDYLVDDIVTMAVQVNGKTRGTVELAPDADESTAVAKAQELQSVKNVLAGKTIAKVIYKPGKILNLIAK
jgi:leucyl-tRNA synthetase